MRDSLAHQGAIHGFPDPFSRWPLRITNTTYPHGTICCADWSPDGQRIAFTRCGDYRGAVFVVPALGGPERKVTEISCLSPGGWVDVKWTGDGDSLVMMDQCTPDAPMGIVVFSLLTGQKRCLHSPQPKELGDYGPVLSPDYKSVAFVRFSTLGVSGLYSVNVAGCNLRRLTFDNQEVIRAMWAADGKRIAFHSLRSGLDGLWQVPAAGGELEPETVFPETGSLSRDGRRLAYPKWNVIAPVKVSILKLSSPGGNVVSEKGDCKLIRR
jgi:Tol biopolymer transport system component